MALDRIPILFDTDIGSDIDDAVCLAYLLAQPRCELVGITTVSGEPLQRAKLADAVCQAVGRTDVPIHSGAAEPLLTPARQPRAPQAAVLDRWSHREDFEPNTAVLFMREIIRSRPGEITLLAVGPMTNVALLLALDPEIPSLLRGFAAMIGVFTNRAHRSGWREWNALNDPYATAIVYRTLVKPHVSWGLDVTTHCRLDAAECRERFRGGALDVVRDMAEVWFEARPEITFHDPLAAVSLFEPDICQYQEGRVTVEVVSEALHGMTLWQPGGEDRPHRIAVEVDTPRFFESYFSVFNP